MQSGIRRLLCQGNRRWWSVIALAMLVNGCGYGYVYYADVDCAYPYDDQPAVIVEFVDRVSGAQLSVDAAGELDDGYRRETLSIYERGYQAGTVYSLAGGYGRTGDFNVSGVARRSPAEADQPWIFGPVRVYGDECGPYTERLTVVLN